MKTLIVSVPSTAISLAGIAAVNCVAPRKVVVRFELLNCTTELERKFVPSTVSVNAESPACLLIGEMLVIVGTGFSTENDWLPDVPPPGALFVTVKLLVPNAAPTLIVMFAVRLSERLTVVEFTTMLSPTFTLLTPVMKPDPVNPTFSVCNRFPLVGFRLTKVGAGLLTVKLTFTDVPPPGPLFVTEKFLPPNAAPALIVMFAVRLSERLTVVVFTVMLSPTFTLLTPLIKPDPLNPTLSVCSRFPLVGLMLVSAGAGLFTVNPFVSVAVPPPGVAFVTETFLWPTAAPALIVMFAVRLSERLTAVETTVMLSPKLTLLTPLMKPDPRNATFIVCNRFPLVGLMLVKVGGGLFTLNPFVSVAVPPPGPGFVT